VGPKTGMDDLGKRKSFTVLEFEAQPVNFLPYSLYRLLYPAPHSTVYRKG